MSAQVVTYPAAPREPAPRPTCPRARIALSRVRRLGGIRLPRRPHRRRMGNVDRCARAACRPRRRRPVRRAFHAQQAHVRTDRRAVRVSRNERRASGRPCAAQGDRVRQGHHRADRDEVVRRHVRSGQRLRHRRRAPGPRRTRSAGALHPVLEVTDASASGGHERWPDRRGPRRARHDRRRDRRAPSNAASWRDRPRPRRD